MVDRAMAWWLSHSQGIPGSGWCCEYIAAIAKSGQVRSIAVLALTPIGLDIQVINGQADPGVINKIITTLISVILLTIVSSGRLKR